MNYPDYIFHLDGWLILPSRERLNELYMEMIKINNNNGKMTVQEFYDLMGVTLFTVYANRTHGWRKGFPARINFKEYPDGRCGFRMPVVEEFT